MKCPTAIVGLNLSNVGTVKTMFIPSYLQVSQSVKSSASSLEPKNVLRSNRKSKECTRNMQTNLKST